MDRTLFNFRGRLLAGSHLNTFGLTRFGLRDIRSNVVVLVRCVCYRIFDERRGADGWSVLWDLNAVRLRVAVRRELAGEDFLVERAGGLFLSPSRDFAPFVRVLGIARRAPGLLDVFFYHRNDGMVGQPPLARTVVVQYVTETQPALLHSTPPR